MNKIEKTPFLQGAELLVRQQTINKETIDLSTVSLFLTPTSSFFIPQEGIGPFFHHSTCHTFLLPFSEKWNP